MKHIQASHQSQINSFVSSPKKYICTSAKSESLELNQAFNSALISYLAEYYPGVRISQEAMYTASEQQSTAANQREASKGLVLTAADQQKEEESGGCTLI